MDQVPGPTLGPYGWAWLVRPVLNGLCCLSFCLYRQAKVKQRYDLIAKKGYEKESYILPGKECKHDGGQHINSKSNVWTWGFCSIDNYIQLVQGLIGVSVNWNVHGYENNWCRPKFPWKIWLLSTSGCWSWSRHLPFCFIGFCCTVLAVSGEPLCNRVRIQRVVLYVTLKSHCAP